MKIGILAFLLLLAPLNSFANPYLPKPGDRTLSMRVSTYAKEIVDRTMTVPGKSVAEAVELARESGTIIRRKPEELYDNSFVLNLDKSGFLKEIWGSENYKR